MAQYFNTHSLAILGLALLAVVAFFLFRDKPKWTDFVALAVLALGLVAAWFAIRPMQTALMRDSVSVQAQIGSGKPVLLEFQSPY